MTGLRIVAQHKAALGQEPGKRETALSTEAKAILKGLREEHERLTDGMVKLPPPEEFKAQQLIGDYATLCLIDGYLKLEAWETEQFDQMEALLVDVPIYRDFLKGIKGIGPIMGGVIYTEIDIHKAKYPSSIWAYAGLDVATDGRGRGKYAEHLRDVEYKNKKGKDDTRKSITFNPFLKTKLLGVLGPCLQKSGMRWRQCEQAEFDKTDESLRAMRPAKGNDDKKALFPHVVEAGSPYVTIYLNYRHRLRHHAVHSEKTDGHRHAMALRYMVKMFIIDLHREWRILEGLPVAVPYHVAKLGLSHGEAA